MRSASTICENIHVMQKWYRPIIGNGCNRPVPHVWSHMLQYTQWYQLTVGHRWISRYHICVYTCYTHMVPADYRTCARSADTTYVFTHYMLHIYGTGRSRDMGEIGRYHMCVYTCYTYMVLADRRARVRSADTSTTYVFMYSIMTSHCHQQISNCRCLWPFCN
jgi:hypothetical protein